MDLHFVLMTPRIAPSILSADFSRLGEQVRVVEDAGAGQVHIDVMDGHFVPNLTMGPVVVEALRSATSLPLDVHLMITDPEDYLESFIKAGADHISFHVEAEGDKGAMLDLLEERGVGKGIAVNPSTPAEEILEFLPRLDMVVVMTVNPGFGGQAFLGDNLDKVRRIRQEEEKLSLEKKLNIEVDGGVDRGTIGACLEAGADIFVAGSAIFGAADPGAATRELIELAGG
ncbi:MAG: ribulose-phosphate 3-epimerase [Planctomycetota bacterium]|nr:ribulose-phosphate 3-epimerase [Planctomycetota bacterium]